MDFDWAGVDWAPAPTPRWRIGTRLRLGRQDRRTADFARRHGAVDVLEVAARIVELGRGSSARASCVRCAGADPGRVGVVYCIVCALVVGGGEAATERTPAVRSALDLTWRTLHRRGHRPVHWNPAMMHVVQAHDLRQWDQRQDVDATQVVALLARARGRAAAALGTSQRAGRRLDARA